MHRGAHGDAPRALALAELRVEPFGELVRAERGADAADVVHSDVGRGLRELFRFDHRDDVHGEGREGGEDREAHEAQDGLEEQAVEEDAEDQGRKGQEGDEEVDLLDLSRAGRARDSCPKEMRR